jgi:octopine/nopaline transport system substrate-binding protein
MKKMTLVFVAVLAGALAGQSNAGDWKKIRIATEGAYKPWNFTDSSGKLVGFELDLAVVLCERMGAQCEIVAQAWDGIIPALQAGKYDAIMAGMSITDKRKKVITFSRAYAATPASFVVLKSSPHSKFSTTMKTLTLDNISADEQSTLNAMVKEFRGKTIGVQTSTTHENFLREYLGKDADIKTYDTQENLDLDLQAGRVDAALASMSYWVPLLTSNEGSEMAMVGSGMTGGPFGAGVGVGTRQKDADLTGMFSKAIDAAIKDGTVKKLAEQWFGFDASAK